MPTTTRPSRAVSSPRRPTPSCGAFRATYDADGSAETEKLPGGYTLRISEDPTGTAIGRTYTRDGDGTTVFTDSITRNTHGQVSTHGGWSDQRYRYDASGRLTGVEDTVDGECIRRTYTLDRRSNRTSLLTAVGAPGADCPASGGTTVGHRYDSADRLVDTGYAYDAFGRTTALPGATVGYHANDLVHRQTADGRRQTWYLDASLRFRSWKVETGAGPRGPRPSPRSTTTTATGTTPAGSWRTPPPVS